jgi:DNA polymerase III sliding clamp (beta) subunit (PCNA family)
MAITPADLVHALIHRLPDARVSMTTASDGQRVTVRSGRHRATLHSLGAPALPEFPRLTDAPPPVSLPLGTLPALSRQLLFACATDGVRISEAHLPLPDGFPPNTARVLPAKSWTPP